MAKKAKKDSERRYMKELECVLTVEEKLAMLKAMLDIEAKQDDIREDAKDVAKQAKSELEELQEDVDALKRCLRTGTQMQDVEVVEVYDWEHKRVVVERTDTGDVVTERAMDSSELQGDLPDVE